MTRFDDLGLAGYERGGGYRPGSGSRPAEVTLRGFVRVAVLLAVFFSVTWLEWEIFGERIGQVLMWLSAAALYVWRGWRDRRYPLAGDEYATDEERNKVRRESVWSFVVAAIWAGTAVLNYVQHGGHSR